MAYTALYRKWRPDSFENIIGQEHIVKTLTNQIKAGRIGHAYLFCGTRGTGKTSTAKVFAKAVNCETPVEGSPCNKCSICENINNNQSINIIEIDAASNNGVDNIREIRDEVRYTPTEGKYKVYIIDEIHMLSQGAFNALLKTLEEPPKHVIFILATTEPHKIPATILSRCQRYDFKRITIKAVSSTLKKYMEEEGIIVEDAALKYLAKQADGSMRDALSILDQCIAYYLGEKITLNKVLEVLGAVDDSVFKEIINALIEKDVKKCMDIIDMIFMQGRDLSQFTMELINYLRNLLVLKSIGNEEAIIEMSEANIEELKEQSLLLHESQIIYYIKTFSELESRIKIAAQKRILLEVEFIKLCEPSVKDSLPEILERIDNLEKIIKEGNFIIQSSEIKTNNKISEERIIKTEQTLKEIEQNKDNISARKKAIPQDIKKAISEFEKLVEKTEGADRAMLTRAIPGYLEDEYLYIICIDEIQKKYLNKPETLQTIDKILEELHNKSFKIKIITQDEYDILAHAAKNITKASQEAKDIFKELKKEINFDIQEI